MESAAKQGMTLRLELFVNDVPTSTDFYSRVLGFETGDQNSPEFAAVTSGAVGISLSLRSGMPGDHPVQLATNERPGRCVEFVLEADDIMATYERASSQSWPMSSELKHQSWGLTDFRISDPDGYYWRITSRR